MSDAEGTLSGRPGQRGPLLAVGLLAGAMLAYEVSLLRILLYASWHHFAFLVVSIALLGFGAAGTALTVLRPRLLGRERPVFFALVLVTAFALPVCTSLAQQVPVEARFAPALLAGQLARWALYWALLAVPFFTGASAVGLALLAARERLPGVYASDLVGSGVGASVAPVAMTAVPPAWLPYLWGGAGLLAALVAGGVRPGTRVAAVLGAAALLAGLAVSWPPHVRVDAFKYRAQVARLEAQGEAEQVALAHGPRGVVELFRGDVFHDIPFLTGLQAPPPLHALAVDGHAAGSVLRVAGPEDASVLDETLMAFPYALAPERPRVLLLGERSGTDVWLAARQGARAVEAVQSHPGIYEVIGGLAPGDGGRVFELPGVEARAEDPRHRVETSDAAYDLVQLVTLQSLAAGAGGARGPGQDWLVTVEGLGACLDRLSPEGILFACRGIRLPPRDNVKLLATLREALRRRGVERPGRRVVVVRDYLAVCTLVKGSAWTAGDVARLRDAIERHQLTPVWFPGIRRDELNQPDVLPGPEDAPGDWYAYAAQRLFDPDPEDVEAFIESWSFDIRPPTDDRPFFHDFAKLEVVGKLREAYGDLWLTRAEIGFLFVLGAIALVVPVAAALTLVPLAFLRAVRSARGKAAAAAYFGAIGLGYLFLEMLALAKLTVTVGDPVVAAALTLSGFLVFSGLGSATARWLLERGRPRPRTLILLLTATGAATVLLLEGLAGLGGALPHPVLLAVSVLSVAPLAFLLGFPLPTGLVRVDRGAPSLVPWAWGVNGFASVLAPPLATACAMTWGYRLVGGLALGLYVVAGVLARALPGAGRGGAS